jgi:hypothetical protein
LAISLPLAFTRALTFAWGLTFTRPLALALTLTLALSLALTTFLAFRPPGRARRTFGRLAATFRSRRTRWPGWPFGHLATAFWTRCPRWPGRPRRTRRGGTIPGVVGIDRRRRAVSSDGIAARFGAIAARPTAAEAAPTRPALAFTAITLTALGRSGIALWIFVL